MLALDVAPKHLEPEPAGDTGQKAEGVAPTQPATVAKPNTEGRKRGPKSVGGVTTDEPAEAGTGTTMPPGGEEKPPQLNVALIKTWMDEEGWTNETLAQKLRISERTVSSMRNNGEYHGSEAVTKPANLMVRDVDDLYLP